MNKQKTPVIWTIQSTKKGESVQITTLAQKLGFPYIEKRIAYHSWNKFIGFLRLSSSAGVDFSKSSPIEPPWPDLIISASLKNEPISNWIKKASKGKSKLVYLGRTWKSYVNYDLIITTPQYQLNKRPNVIENKIPISTSYSVSNEQICIWKEKEYINNFPKPNILVSLGGESGPVLFGSHSALSLAAQIKSLYTQTGGSIFITTSPRTNPKVGKILVDQLTEYNIPNYSYFYNKNDSTLQNPYYTMLNIADYVVVTSDSISLMSEALIAGKPLFLFDTSGKRIADKKYPPRKTDRSLRTELYKLFLLLGPKCMTIDISLVHKQLICLKHACWLTDKLPKNWNREELNFDSSIERVKELLLHIPHTASETEKITS